jgi:predicted ATPase
MPSTVKMIIAARLDQLPVPERQVILDASVVGDFFWRGSLEALRPGAALAQRIQELERRDLIRRSPSSRIRGDEELAFKHALIREVAYATLPKGVREERHGVVARFLEQAAGNPATYASILAHHWREAGDARRASEYLLIAAQQAGRGWAYEEAVNLCSQALELIPEGDRARRRRALMVRAVALQSGRHAAMDFPRG